MAAEGRIGQLHKSVCHSPITQAMSVLLMTELEKPSCALSWLLPLLISRTQIPGLSGYSASIIFFLSITICEQDTSGKMHRNKYRTISLRGTGQRTDDKKSLGVNPKKDTCTL
jgi:hypothetical protein